MQAHLNSYNQQLGTWISKRKKCIYVQNSKSNENIIFLFKKIIIIRETEKNKTAASRNDSLRRTLRIAITLRWLFFSSAANHEN